MAPETSKRDTEIEGPPEHMEKVKEKIMATKEQAVQEGMQMFSAPLALMGSNINWLEMMNKNMESVHRATMGSIRYFTACQEATFTLMRERMEKNQEMLRRCSEINELPSLVHESAEFHRAAIEDYVRHTKNLADMTLAAVNEQIDPLEKRTQETLSTVSKAA